MAYQDLKGLLLSTDLKSDQVIQYVFDKLAGNPISKYREDKYKILNISFLKVNRNYDYYGKNFSKDIKSGAIKGNAILRVMLEQACSNWHPKPSFDLTTKDLLNLLDKVVCKMTLKRCRLRLQSIGQVYTPGKLRTYKQFTYHGWVSSLIYKVSNDCSSLKLITIGNEDNSAYKEEKLGPIYITSPPRANKIYKDGSIKEIPSRFDWEDRWHYDCYGEALPF